MALGAVRCSRSEELIRRQIDSVDDLVQPDHAAMMMQVEQRWQLQDLQTFLIQLMLDRGYQVSHSPLKLFNKELICTVEQAPSHIAELQMGMDEDLVQPGECGLIDQLE